MNWHDLLIPQREGRYGGSGLHKARAGSLAMGDMDLRSEFEKDYHRIIGSSSFRRLQDKTQVFPLDKSDFVRTRLTHSLEVSSFAASLGQNVAPFLMNEEGAENFSLERANDIAAILKCAGLIHDIGNPPFGHFGEEVFRHWFSNRLSSVKSMGRSLTAILRERMVEDLRQFDGNAQALRLVSRLHFLVNEYGMNLTYPLLATIIKYPVPSHGSYGLGRWKKGKFGFFLAEEELYRDISAHTGSKYVRHPLTFLLEAADDLAYLTADIEDSYKKGFLTYGLLEEEIEAFQKQENMEFCFDALSLLRRQHEHGKNRGAVDPDLYAVQNWLVRLQTAFIYGASSGFQAHYREIMAGDYREDLFFGGKVEWLTRVLREIAYKHVFTSSYIFQMEVSSASILNDLLDRFVPAAVHFDTEEGNDMMEAKLMSMFPKHFIEQYRKTSQGKTEEEKLYLRLLLVTDFISGMTDTFARDLYRKMNGFQ